MTVYRLWHCLEPAWLQGAFHCPALMTGVSFRFLSSTGVGDHSSSLLSPQLAPEGCTVTAVPVFVSARMEAPATPSRGSVAARQESRGHFVKTVRFLSSCWVWCQPETSPPSCIPIEPSLCVVNLRAQMRTASIVQDIIQPCRVPWVIFV